MNLMDLHKPFAAEDVEWRSQKTGVSNGKPWTMVLCYITNRAIMDRLDEVCGPENWKNHFETGPGGGILCGISIKIDDEWKYCVGAFRNKNSDTVKIRVYTKKIKEWDKFTVILNKLFIPTNNTNCYKLKDI